MDSEQFKIINKKLDILASLLTYSVTQGKQFQEQVAFLDSIGLQPIEIATVLGKTRNNVDQALHRLRTKKKDNNIIGT